jgi:hypothetical protein
MSNEPTFALLRQFEATFRNGPYIHRNSQLGNRIADYLYEDLYSLGFSRRFNDRVDARSHVLNLTNVSPGIRARRGDGSFGDLVPGAPAMLVPGFRVARGPTADVEIGAEVKILAKAMIKQIDRVVGDLRRQADQFHEKSTSALTFGIVGVNFSEHYLSYEGDRRYPTDGTSGNLHPIQEATRAERELLHAEDAYTEFIQLGFRATNEPPFEFQWNDLQRTQANYASRLLRLLKGYESTF